MQTINNTSIPAEQNVSVDDFVESVYLPWIKQNRRPSMYKNARDVWRQHIRPLMSRERHTVRAIRTWWLNQIGKEDLSRNSLKRIKSTLSGMFTLAKQLGYFDGVNPVQGTSVNPRARDAEETYAYTLQEINSMLMSFPEPASTAFAVAAFAGLRRGEIEGLDWSISMMMHFGYLAASGMAKNYQQKRRRARHPSLLSVSSAIALNFIDYDAETSVQARSSQAAWGPAYPLATCSIA